MPPPQYLQFLDWESEVLRLWAWVVEHTIGRGPRENHEPGTPVIAVGTKGEPLTLKNAAADLDMDMPNVYRAWNKLEKIGCVKKTAEGYLVLCGEFKAPKRKARKRRKSCTDNYSARLQRELAKLPSKLHEEYLRDDKRDVDVFKCGSRMDMAGWRYWLEKQQNARNKAFGLTVRRHERSDPEERARKRREVDLVLSGVENLVQIILEGILYNIEIDHLQIMKNGHKKPLSVNGNGSSHSAHELLSESFPEKTIEIKKTVGRQAGRSVIERHDPPACLPTSPSPVNGEYPRPSRLEEIRKMLERTLAHRIQASLPVMFLAETENNLGGAPVDHLEKRIIARIESIRSWALVPQLARDVGDLWRADPEAASVSVPVPKLSKADKLKQEFLEECNARAKSANRD